MKKSLLSPFAFLSLVIFFGSFGIANSPGATGAVTSGPHHIPHALFPPRNRSHFENLASLFEMAEKLGPEDVSGIHSGRCVMRDTPNTLVNDAMIAKRIPSPIPAQSNARPSIEDQDHAQKYFLFIARAFIAASLNTHRANPRPDYFDKASEDLVRDLIDFAESEIRGGLVSESVMENGDLVFFTSSAGSSERLGRATVRRYGSTLITRIENLRERRFPSPATGRNRLLTVGVSTYCFNVVVLRP